MGLSHWTINDLDRRARASRLSLPRLTHLAALARVLQGFIGMGGLDLNKDHLIKKRWDILWEVIDIYRKLPIKPAPPFVAVQKLQQVEAELRQGRQPASTREFEDAIEIAPWWPEAHYNLAVFARDSIYTLNLRRPYLPGEFFDNRRIAAQEFVFYLHLAPTGANAKVACKQLKEWGLKCPRV